MSIGQRIISLALSSVVLFGMTIIDDHHVAFGATCASPEANVPPPPGSPTTPSGQLPIGRRPSHTVPTAPLPKLGPLIASLVKPGLNAGIAATGGTGAVQQQARIPGAMPGTNQIAPRGVQPPGPSTDDPDEAIRGSQTSLVEWVTGPNSPNQTLQRFGISGTDLGISWDNGDPVNRQVLMAFGDTFGYCQVPGQQWRHNVLLRSQDPNLSTGIHVGPGIMGNRYSGSPLRQVNFSKQIIPNVRLSPVQDSMIPTAGIAVAGKQYLSFMSIRQWGRDGEWSTNYSAIAVSSDNGENWGVYPTTVRPSSPGAVPGGRYLPGNENFQQGAFLKPGDGYLYAYGTPPGRAGAVYLSRVPERYIPDLTKYQYWNATSGWIPVNPAGATPIIPGPVGEMSVAYNSYLKRYLTLYANGANDIVARTAPSPQGPWGPEQVIVWSAQMPGGIYAPYIHPWSSGKDLYFTMSLWNAYDVMLMHTVFA